MAYGVQPPAFRVPDETRPGTVTLLVSDLARSLDYYEQILGLRTLERSGGAAVVGAGVRPLLSLMDGAGGPISRRAPRLGLYHFALLVPDRAFLGRLLLHLETLGQTVASADHAVSEALYLWDPDGLGIEVYADRPREEWRTSGGELFMTTEPLNVMGLLDAAGPSDWSGLPAGTRMGHIHLHVGDLPQAEAFYHTGLGLDKVVWSYPGALFLSAGGYHHHLAVNTWAGNAPPRAATEAGLVEWELRVPSADAMSAAGNSLAAAGATVETDADSVVALDPWGTRVRIRAGID